MKRVLSALALTALLLAAGGCSMFTEYRAAAAIAKEGVYTAIEDRKAVNDVKADVLLAVPCDASLGAVMRLENARQRAILIELCGGPVADSQMTVDDLAAMMSLLGRP